MCTSPYPCNFMVTTCTRPLYSYSLQAGSVHTIDIYKYFDLQVTIWCSLHVPIYKVSYLVLFKQYYLRWICPFIRLFFWFIQLNVSPNRLLGLVHLCFFLIWVRVRIRVWCLTHFQQYSSYIVNCFQMNRSESHILIFILHWFYLSS
jgi:hypothetical protein